MTTIKTDFGNPLVSIIIPAYNVEKYIVPCIESLFNQIYRNIQVIIAYDEKSTDGTKDRLDFLAKKYPLIIDVGVDKGSGDARNRGFRFATGEYVIFVDGDDEVMPDYLLSMLNVFADNPQLNVVLCNCICVDEGNEVQAKITAAESQNTTYLLSSVDLLYKKLWHEVSSAPWSYLIKRQFIIENQLKFPPYSHADDSYYTYTLTANSDFIGYCDQKLYVFIQHDTSITHVLPDYWWRKYDSFVSDMNQYFKERNSSFCTDFIRHIQRVRAYMAARRLSYNMFIDEMKHYNIDKLEKLSYRDHVLTKLSGYCFNLSKRMYWCLVRVMNPLVSRVNPLTQR